MKYSVEKAEKYTVFTLNEENLNSLIAPKLKSEFIILYNEGVSNLIFDLTNVKFVDSSGLSAILTANRLFSAVGNFIIANMVHPNVQKLIKISRLEDVLNIQSSTDEAIKFATTEKEETAE